MKIDGGPRHGFLAGGGKIAELIAAFDWAQTSLGPIDAWSPILKTSISIALRSPVPIVMLWGADGIMIYNDAYSQFAGKRHPRLLGSKVLEGWPEVAEFNAHVMQVVLAGDTLQFSDQELTLYRNGGAERVWMNLDYSPIVDDSGTPVAVIAIVVETTGKVTAESWLASERERLRQMFEQAPGFMAMLDGPQHVFELTNAAYMQLVGHRNVIGKPVREALPDIAGQGFYELLDQVYASGEPFIGRGIKAQLQRTPGADSEERFVDLIYQPVRDPDGKVTGIFVQGDDVTEALLAQESVRASGEMFRQFAEAMPNHFWTGRPDGYLDWFNSRVYQYSGAEPGSLDGEQWAAIVHPEDVAAAAERWMESVGTGNPYEAEFRLRRHDGVYRWHIARAVALPDASGRIGRWIGTNTDIDDQQRIARQLAESERRFRLSQQAAGIASLELDIETGLVIGSDHFWEIWGLGHRESVSIAELESIVLPEFSTVRSTPETRVKGTAQPNVEYRIRRPDNGQIRWLSRHIEFIHDAQGKPIKMFGVMQDITDRKEAEARQNLLTHELEHRIKNILAMVSAVAAQTLRNTDLATAATNFTERLRAISTAHDIMTRTRWTTAAMEEVLRDSVTPFPADRIVIEGCPVSLGPKMALTLALAVNELGTNSTKYGALSVDTGRVEIRWSLRPGAEGKRRELVWTWTERGGPPVSPPSRRGFGRFLIERVLAADFDGTVKLEYASEGLECTLVAPAPEERAS